MISMNQIWDDTIAFIRREQALLVPVALATLLIGDVIGSLATGAGPEGQPSSAGFLPMLLALLISFFGQLTIIALVLRPGRTVGEAMRLAVSCYGKLLLVLLVVMALVAAAMIPIAIAVQLSGVDMSSPESMANLPGWVSLIMVIVLGGLIWFGIRLSLINGLIVDRNPPLFEAMKSALVMSKGISARLAVIAVVYLVTALILTSATRFVLGSGFALLGNAIGSPFLGKVLTALGTGLVGTALSTIATVFLAILYWHRSGGAMAKAFR
jgi:hypothetical protein